MRDAEQVLDTIDQPVRREIVVSRSRFIADLAPVADVADADALVAAARRELHDARHHCFAYVLGAHGQQSRSNDDGEPAGTAGAPMLAVLQGAQLTDVAVVVTRYFGGTLLGAGGLVRAYSGAVTHALDAVRRVRRRRLAVFQVHAAHADAGQLEHRLRIWAATVDGRVEPGVYDTGGVTIEVAAPPAAHDALRTLLDASGIAQRCEDVGERIQSMP